jgi:lysozyme family protein
MTDVLGLIAANQKRWDGMHYVTSRIPEIKAVADSLLAHKAQYVEIAQGVQEITHKQIPWVLVSVVDQREHDANLGLCNSYLGNGQPLGQVTTIEPQGRGPFFNHPTDKALRGAFFRGALDALIDVQKINDWDDWTPGGTLTFLEGLNGYGYANGPKGNPPMPSPYIWGSTNEQTRGKYVSDHNFDPTVMDTQLGCAPMIRYMMGLDSSITLPPGVPQPIPTPTPIPTPVPVPIPVPVPTPEPKPMPTPTPITLPQIDLGSLLTELLPIVPGIAMGIPAVAPFTPLIQVAVNAATKAKATGGITSPDLESLLATEMYNIALLLKPTLKGT